jgi:hypothetical protein
MCLGYEAAKFCGMHRTMTCLGERAGQAGLAQANKLENEQNFLQDLARILISRAIFSVNQVFNQNQSVKII